MKISEIKSGEVFCIEGSKTYPKLKLSVGYADMRNEIVQRCEAHTMNFDCELMSEGAVAGEFKKYGMTLNDVKNLKRELSVRFN
ncbi:unnamed protein product [marine sediment metagenome]|uniref:Uncharacterized protein n=1 Tax=marine sediment metagenome TaxID=412755 RepID=X1G5Y8_9ZZZZ